MLKLRENFGKELLALFFLLFIIIVGFKTYTGIIKNKDTDEIWLKTSWLRLNSLIARELHVKGLYSELGLYITDENYVVAGAQKTTTDYEYEQVVNLKKYLDDRGISLLYVNAPTKYIDDTLFETEFGVESYSNKNADVFMGRIEEAGVANIDLREELCRDGMDITDMFYRTDHHWTTRSGLWATEKVSSGLNDKCGFQIDVNIFDESNYTFVEYENCWLGEQGKKIGVDYLGLDDYTVVMPKYNTDIVLTDETGVHKGQFDVMIDKTRYNIKAGEDVYSAPSWHYSYLPNGRGFVRIHNNSVNQGKILVLADSYSQVVLPFLSLGVSEVDKLVLRGYSGDLKQFIAENNYDAVVVLYAQFMIGAHDNPDSANYEIFTFDK